MSAAPGRRNPSEESDLRLYKQDVKKNGGEENPPKHVPTNERPEAAIFFPEVAQMAEGQTQCQQQTDQYLNAARIRLRGFHGVPLMYSLSR